MHFLKIAKDCLDCVGHVTPPAGNICAISQLTENIF